MVTRLLLAATAAGLSLTGWAVPRSHSPFYPSQNYHLALSGCPASRAIESVHPPSGTVLFQAGDWKLELSIMATHHVVRLFEGERPSAGPVAVPVPPTMPLDVSEEAICDDLNGDGQVDWLVTLWLHGNGLGAAASVRLIVLSTPAARRYWMVPTLFASTEDFVTLGSPAALTMITTGHLPTDSEPPHSYYVYDLWRFTGEGAVLPANDIDSRFPKAVRATHADNHAPASSMADWLPRRQVQPPRELFE